MSLPERTRGGQYPAFTSVGGYPIIYLTKRDSILCAECASDDEANEDDPVAAADVYWEGAPMSCDACNAEIESAYGDPEAEPEEPDEDDITTEDRRHWYQSGKLYVTGHIDDVRAAMERDGFFPNLWFISDHGNAHLIK